MKTLPTLSILIALTLGIEADLRYGYSFKPDKEIKIPMEAERWDYAENQVEFINYQSEEAMKILKDQGQVVLNDFLFTDGTIEFDVALTSGAPFVSIYFRQQNPDNAECFYLRTYRAGNPDGADAAQYAPMVEGVNLWDVLGHYQGPAVLKAEGWNHIKLVVSGERMVVFVNNLEQPTLNIPKLEGNTTQGSLAFEGRAIFTNLVINSNEVEGLTPQAGYDPTYNDPRYLRKWSVSEPTDFPRGREVSEKDFPTDQTRWDAIAAERRGLMNLTRRFGKNENRRLVWLKTKISSETDQQRRLDLGFSDEVWIFINDRLLYVDKNLYGSPIMKEPDGRCSIENTSLMIPLQAGDNELLIGIANDFYGWGIMARLDQIENVTIQK